MLRQFKNYFLFILALLAIGFVLRKLQILPSFGDIFRSKAVTIDETPILIQDIKELSELTTMASYDEVVVDSITADPATLAIKTITGLSLSPLSPGYDHLVLICKGRVSAGIDLSVLQPGNIFREKDSVSLALPTAKILDVIVNPSDVETFIETGDWSAEAFERVKIKAREKIKQRAISEGILGKANTRSRLLMDNFLHQAGFAKVHVYTKY